MLVVVAVWFAIAGGVAVLAGLSGLHRSRRLRRHGVPAWGMAVRSPVPTSARDEDGSPVPVLIQFTLADGRVMERIAPPARPRSCAAAGAADARLVQPRRPGRCAGQRPGDP